MAIARTIIGLTALIAAAPLIAQSNESPRNIVADAQEAPQTQALNKQVESNVASTDAQNAANQVQYEADKAAYARALREHHRDVVATDNSFVRQQVAYADAMRDYRAQVAACKHGSKTACDMPPPDPMNYM